ncbi:unnamed protein product [Sphagnum compactum]
MSCFGAGSSYPCVTKEYLADVEKCRKKLRGIISEKHCAPLVLRFLWHSAGTYNKKAMNGGPFGSIRFPEELKYEANAGLEIAFKILQPLKETFPKLSYGDFLALAGVVAVEVTGGPEVPFHPGRKDAMKAAPDGRLPDPNKGADMLRSVFGAYGMSDQDIVALSGAHTIGRCHKERSNFEGPWTSNPLLFDNSYFKELLSSAPKEGLLQLPSDKCLVNDPIFRKYVELYAKNEDKFFEDYAMAHMRLSELG